jgi:hypothetical protein
MFWRVCVAMVAGVMMMADPVLAGTKIVSARAAQSGGGPEFKVIVGVPKGLGAAGDGALADNTLYVFPEQQGVTLSAPLPLGRTVIAKGTKVDSFYVCIDTERRAADPGPRGGTDYTAAIRFDNSVLLGTALRPGPLKQTAEVLGRPNVTYADNRFVGVDPFWMGQDGQSFDGRDFLMRGNANGIDCMRLVFKAK